MDADSSRNPAVRPTTGEIAAELNRVLASSSFSASKRLSAFLRYVAERAVSGQSDEIKEYQIGVEVYGRGSGFEPKLDNIVRVEASRLRAKLREYYEDGGHLNPVRIEIPRGTYVPVFRLTAAVPPAPEETPLPCPAAAKPRPLRWLAMAAALVVGMGILLAFTIHRGPGVALRRRIAVIGLKEIPSEHASAPWLSTALSELVTLNFAEVEQLQTVPVDVAAQMSSDLGLQPSDGLGREALQKIRQSIGADLIVAGAYFTETGGEGDAIRVDLRVQDTRTGETIATASERGSAGDLSTLASEACSELGRRLGLGAHAGPSATVASNLGAMRLYSEGLDALRRFDTPRARDILEQSVQSDPSNALAWSALAQAWYTLGDDSKARETAHQALTLASHLGRVEQLAIEARAHMNAKEWPDAIRMFTSLWRMAPDSLDDGLAVAECQYYGGEPKAALATLDKLRELPRPLGDDPRIDFSEARAYGATGDYRLGLAPIRAAERKAKQRGQRLLYARSRRFEAGLLSMLGLPGAVEALSESRQLCEELGDRVCVISALRVEANYSIHSHLAHARDLYKKGLAMAHEAGSAGEEAALRQGLIIADAFLGDLAGAEQTCREGIDGAEKAGLGAEFFEYELGSVYARQGRLSQAQAVYHRLLSPSGSSLVEPTHSNTLVALTRLLLMEGKPKEAADRAREALEIVRRTGSDDGLFEALRAQGDALTTLGDWAGARKSYDEAGKHAKDDGANNGELEASLGEWCLRQGEGAEAERHVRKALEDFHSVDNADRGLWAQTALVRALLVQHKSSEALHVAAEISPAAQQTQDAEVRIQILLSEAQAAAQGSERAKARQTLSAALAEAKLLGYGELERQARELRLKL